MGEDFWINVFIVFVFAFAIIRFILRLIGDHLYFKHSKEMLNDFMRRKGIEPKDRNGNKD